MTAKQILTNREKQENELFVIKQYGKGFYVVKGVEIPKKEFEKLHPINTVERKPNPDRRFLWVGNMKSY